MFKVATWNVNSLRVRLSHLLAWLADEQPDVIALQETKLEDKDFPLDAIQNAGYQAVYSGQKTYNGVALFSRQAPIIDVAILPPYLNDPQKRVLAVTVGPYRIINLYVPNGGSVHSEKYLYKLHWLENLHAYLKEELILHPHLIVLGDFNIAPQDNDVHDPKAWEGQVLVSQPERDALQKLFDLGLKDAFRLLEQGEGHYSWWDYRAAAFRRNLGLRIDHILLSSVLALNCIACYIDKLPRSWERPSDHAPVVVCLADTDFP
jgi:exodeoxyribonuclease-3